MPSGEYTNNTLKECGICGKKMRPLYQNKKKILLLLLMIKGMHVLV